MANPDIDKIGTKRWYRNEEPHPDDGSTIVYPDGDEEWWRKGGSHRDNGIAIV